MDQSLYGNPPHLPSNLQPFPNSKNNSWWLICLKVNPNFFSPFAIPMCYINDFLIIIHSYLIKLHYHNIKLSINSKSTCN
jgi:hypothetical protein